MGEMSKGETPTHNSGKGGRKSLILGVVITLVVLIGVIVFLAVKLMTQSQSQAEIEEPKEKKSVVLPENVDEIVSDWVEESNTYTPEYFTLVQNSTWTFPDGSSNSTDAYVENDKENETAFYFDVVVDSTGELVYSSPVLELGAKISGFKLDKALDAGEYGCTMTYHLVDEDQKELTTAIVGITIIVQN